MDDDLGDELLGLIFTASHPMLSREARVALTLRVVGGLTTDEIARAFLCSEATIAQRIVGAKKAVVQGGRPGAPEGADLIADLIQRARKRIAVMPGAGLDPANVADFVRRTGAREVHAACRAPVADLRGGLDAELGFVTPGLQDTGQAQAEAMRRALDGR